MQNNLTTNLPRFTVTIRWLLIVALALTIGATWWLAHERIFSPEVIGRYRSEHPFLAVALFMLVYAMSVLACLPTLPLNLGAGYLWGGLTGGVLAALGVTTGGLVAFLSARAFAGKRLEPLAGNGALAAVLREFHAGDWRLVAFVRLNPVFPTGPLNYLLGLTPVKAGTFVWSSFLFLLPPAIAVAFIGDTLQTFTASAAGVNDYLRNMLILSAAVTALVGLKVMGRLLRARHEKN